jgi:succinyldiaminopimelate transaminase
VSGAGPQAPPANPRLARFAAYPFVELDERKARARARGLDVIDLSIGDPREETPAFIRSALAGAIPARSSYPTVLGRAALREAIAGWCARSFGAALDPATQILPANGSKEAIFNVHLALVDPEGPRRRVLIPTPAYPVYERAAVLAGGEPMFLPLTEAGGWLPDLAAVPAATWDETAILWLNYPHNPTGAVAPVSLYRQALDLAARHGFAVCSDEAYATLAFGAAPAPSLLSVGGGEAFPRHGLSFHTLSKRSAMTGYRSGFVAGDPDLVATFRALRPSLGVATPEFVQRAAEAAWADEDHVAVLQRAFAARRAEALAFLDGGAARAAGFRVVPNEATFYLWVAVPPGTTSDAIARRWLDEAGVAVVPGEAMGETGAGYLRIALVPTLEECHAAWARLEPLLDRIHP